ncbi:hypothetical protein [Parapedobacter sp. 2B3]|uniref:hypothetical protein n=1 Tax=Parapedobacter sp. 2B3 TaxID=3342381 RepID=UPI0035B64E87
MSNRSEIIKKVAQTVRKTVLLGALVGGVSMASYATETPVGPTIEKAQLETVDINLDAVVVAITKANPDWVRSLPSLTSNKTHVQTVQQWYSLNATASSNPNNQMITGLSDEPEEYDSEGCAQLDNEGDFCTVLIEFPGTTAPNITSGSVQDALTAHPGSSVVTSKASLGYARQPDI